VIWSEDTSCTCLILVYCVNNRKHRGTALKSWFYGTIDNHLCIIFDGELADRTLPNMTVSVGIFFFGIRKFEVSSLWAVTGRTTGNRKILHGALNSIKTMTTV